MQRSKRFFALLAAACMALIFSCQKDKRTIVNRGPFNNYVIDSSLIGKQFIFNATWLFWSDAMGDQVYTIINPARTFSIPAMANQKVEVSIRLDSLSNWTFVPFEDWYSPPPGYVSPHAQGSDYDWYFPHFPYADNTDFIIDNYPIRRQLIGNKVQVKVTFL